MDPAIWSRVQKGEVVHASNVKVGVDKYFVCYVPIMNADHDVIGAAWAGESMAAVKSHINYVVLVILLTVVASIVLFALAIIIFARKVDAGTASSLMFIYLVMYELLFAFSCKNTKESILNKKIFDNKNLNLGILGIFIVQIIVWNKWYFFRFKYRF